MVFKNKNPKILASLNSFSYFCIRKAASRHNCPSKLGKFCSQFAFALHRHYGEAGGRTAKWIGTGDGTGDSPLYRKGII